MTQGTSEGFSNTEELSEDKIKLKQKIEDQ